MGATVAQGRLGVGSAEVDQCRPTAATGPRTLLDNLTPRANAKSPIAASRRHACLI